MSMLAVSTGNAAFAVIVLALGLVGALAALALLARLVRPILEIRRYADDVLEAGLGIARNVDGVDELVRTRELATAVPGLLEPRP